MTTSNKLWAAGMLLLFGGAGGSVMAGYVPWTQSGVSVFDGFAAFAQLLVERFGNILAGLTIWLVGIFVAIACMFGDDGSTDAGCD